MRELGTLGDPDPVGSARDATTVAMYEALTAAIRSGRVEVEYLTDEEGRTTIRTVTRTPATATCPACERVPAVPGAMAPLGEDGALVSTCVACASVSRSVDAVYRVDPMREADT
jgi:Zn ribbon nucleic-acid-binding protein